MLVDIIFRGSLITFVVRMCALDAEPPVGLEYEHAAAFRTVPQNMYIIDIGSEPQSSACEEERDMR
jgi:hypothetical protein